MDEQCHGQLACVNNECINPCNSLPCGVNAYCEPENHAPWCRCYPGFAENERGECVSRKCLLNWAMIKTLLILKIIILQCDNLFIVSLFFCAL